MPDDVVALREAVRAHRAELLHAHLRWPDVGYGSPQIVSADKALWTAAGVEEHPYEDEPITRLHGLVDRFRDALEAIVLGSDAVETAEQALGMR